MKAKVIQFYNAYEIKGPCGTRRYDVKSIGHKWVRIKERPSPRWTRIKRKVWNQMMECKSFKVIEQS